MTASDTDVPLLSDIGTIQFQSGAVIYIHRMTTMTPKIDALIREYKKERDVLAQISILVAVRNQMDVLSKDLAKKVK